MPAPSPGERAPFDEFYATHYPRLLRFAAAAFGGSEADDVAQEAMARAYVAYDRFDHDRDPWPWLTAIARRAACDARVAARRALAVPAVANEVAAVTDVAEQAELRDLVRCALDRLDPSDRAVLVLRAWHDVPFGELAELAGRSPNAVRQQLFRARRRLAAEYDALGGRLRGLATPFAMRWTRLRDRAAAVTQAVTALPAALPVVLVTSAVVAGFGMPGAGPAAFGVTHAGPAARTAAPTRFVRPVVAAGHGEATTRRAAPAPPPAPRVVVENESRGIPTTPGSHRHDRTAIQAGGRDVEVGSTVTGGPRHLACAALALGCPREGYH